MQRLVHCMCLATAVLCGSVQVHAQTQDDAGSEQDRVARMHFETGTALFESGDYEQAIESYRQAYALSPRPRLLFNIALGYERLGQLENAIQNLRAYLAASPRVANRGRLELRIRRMEQRLQEQRAKAQPVAAPLEQASAPKAEPGSSAAELEPRSRWTAPVIASASVSAAGVLMVATLGPMALSERGKQDDSCAPACSDGDLKRMRWYGALSDVGLGLAIVGAAVGTLLWFRVPNGEQGPPGAEVALGLGPNGAAARWSF